MTLDLTLTSVQARERMGPLLPLPDIPTPFPDTSFSFTHHDSLWDLCWTFTQNSSYTRSFEGYRRAKQEPEHRLPELVKYGWGLIDADQGSN